MTVPNELTEAAEMDGCGHIRKFLFILLPLAKGALATICIFSFIDSWNAYMWPMIVTNKVDMRTVQTGIRYMINPDIGTEWARVMAAATIVIAPVMLVFVILQKYFIEGVVSTGIK